MLLVSLSGCQLAKLFQLGLLALPRSPPQFVAGTAMEWHYLGHEEHTYGLVRHNFPSSNSKTQNYPDRSIYSPHDSMFVPRYSIGETEEGNSVFHSHSICG